MLIAKAIDKYKIPREKLVILTKCFGTLNDDPRGSRLPPGAEDTKEYVNKHGPLHPFEKRKVFILGLSRKHIFEAVEASLKRLKWIISIYFKFIDMTMILLARRL